MQGGAATDIFYDWRKMTLTITNRCNLKCVMCSSVRQTPVTLPEETAMHCADFAIRRGFKEVEIGGGEPTLPDYFGRLLDKLCRVDGMIVKVVTNGVSLNEEELDTLASYPELNVQISIDGLRATHDTIRGVTGAFERSAESIEALARLGCRNLSIHTVVQRPNLHELVQTYERFKHLPLRFHSFSLIEGHDFCPEQMFRPEENGELARVLRALKRRADADGREVLLSDALLRSFQLRVMCPMLPGHPGLGCTVVRRSLIIAPEGFALSCWQYPWIRDERRNVYKRTLDEIVDDPEIRRDVQRVTEPGGCRGCSTLCYMWDDGFRAKMMHPALPRRARQNLLFARETLKVRFPKALHLFRRVKHRLGLPTPPGFSDSSS